MEYRHIDVEFIGGIEAGSHRLAFMAAQSPDQAKRDFAIRQMARDAGVNTPSPKWLDADGEAFGEPGCFVDAELVGNCVAAARSELSDEDGDQLAFKIGQDLARFHWIKSPHRKELPANPQAEARDAWVRRLSDMAATLGAAGIEDPIFELALVWLRDHAPTFMHPTMIHGDFGARGLLRRDGQALIASFAAARWSDPMEDVGRFCARVLRGHHYQREAAGVGSRDAFYDGYRDIAGPNSILAESVRFWEIAATTHLGVSALSNDGLADGAMEVGRVSPRCFLALEAQYDLLLDLGG